MFIGNPEEEKKGLESRQAPVMAQLASSKGLRKAGGLSLIAFAGLVALSQPLTYAVVPVLAPTSPTAGIQALPGLSSTFTAFLVNFTAADLFGMTGFVVLAIALVGATRSGSLVVALLTVVGFGIDIATDISLRFTQITIATEYAVAMSDAQRGGLLATYQFATDFANTSLLVGLIFMTGLASVVVGYAMLRSNGLFSKIIAYLGVANGVMSIPLELSFGNPAFWPVALVSDILTIVFCMMAGWRLFRI